jgi:spore germination protein
VAIFVYVIILLEKRYPGMTIAEYGVRLVGKYLGNLYNILLSLYYLVLSAWVLRSFADAVKLFLLDSTPLEIIMIAMILTSSYLVLHGLESLCRMSEVFFPIFILPFFAIWLLAVGEMDYGEIYPVLSKGFMPVLQGTSIAYGAFAGFGVLIFILPHLRHREKGLTYSLTAVIIISAIFLLVFIGSLASFGKVELTYRLYPSLDISRTIQIPGGFIERFEAIVLTLWLLSVFLTVTSLYYFSLLNLAITFQLKEPRCLTYFYPPVILFFALLPDNFSSVIEMDIILKYFSLFLAFGVLFFFLISVIKGDRVKNAENS